MRVLVLNSGSSSIKHRLFDMPGDREIGRGAIERIGDPAGGRVSLSIAGGETSSEEAAVADHARGVELMADRLAGAGLLPRPPEVVAHRVVHGGESFSAATVLDDATLAEIDRVTPLAPLHNPANLLGARLLRDRFPGARHVAVFDTAFHQTIPDHAARYAVPNDWRQKYGIRRYGFHGTSHRWASSRAAELLGKPVAALKTVVLHLGAGASVCAVDGGRSIDTSMGMTPLEGLIMATRSGDLDAGVLLHLQREHGYTPEQLDRLLNRQSGLVGLCGAGDLRDVLASVAAGDARATVALDAYCYRIAKYVGAYAVALGGLDALVFTAGVGEHSPEVRRRVAEQLGVLGVRLDVEANRGAAGGDVAIDAADSAARVLVVAANEELQIARESTAALG